MEEKGQVHAALGTHNTDLGAERGSHSDLISRNCYSLSCCIRNCLKRIGIDLLLSLKVYNIYVSSLLHVYMIT